MQTRKTVLVGPKDGEFRTFEPGEDVPSDWADLIDDAVKTVIFEDDPDEEEFYTDTGETKVRTGNSLSTGGDGGAGTGEGDYEDMSVPRLRQEATKLGVDLGDARKKDEIIAKLRENAS